MKALNDWSYTGVASGFFITALVLSATASTVMLTDNTDETMINEEEINKYVNETILQVSTYFKVRDKLGLYQQKNNSQVIQKVAILISPYYSTSIDLTKLIIKLQLKDEIGYVYFQHHQKFNASNSLFDQRIWNMITPNEFGTLYLRDSDNSIKENNFLDSATDLFYLTFNISERFSLQKGDKLEVTLIPAFGVEKKITLNVPYKYGGIVHL